MCFLCRKRWERQVFPVKNLAANFHRIKNRYAKGTLSKVWACKEISSSITTDNGWSGERRLPKVPRGYIFWHRALLQPQACFTPRPHRPGKRIVTRSDFGINRLVLKN